MTVRGFLRIAISLSALTWAVMLFSAPASLASTADSIIGGKVAEPGSFPWLAFVVDFRGEEVSGCTGTVVAPNLILTAGHCAEDPDTGETREPGGYSVFTGNVDWSKGEVSGVSGVIAYPHLTSVSVESTPDAALLELSSPIESPAVRLADSEIWGPGTEAVIAGWGRTNYEQVIPPPQLRWASTVVQDGEWCESAAPGFDPLGQSCTIDAPSYDSGTCHGDSGGPLLEMQPGGGEFIEIGITSSGPAECSTAKPDVFTRSDTVASWVNARIKELTPPPSPPAPVETLPRMTRTRALALARRGLTEAFGAKFKHRFGYRASCHRIAAAKLKCGVGWSHRPDDYYGWITVYYLLTTGEVLSNYRYAIHWVNDLCDRLGHHKGRCRIHTRRRAS